MMPLKSRTLVLMVSVGLTMALVTGCTFGSGVDGDEVSGPVGSQNQSAPPLQDFTDQVAVIATWDSACPPMNLEPVVDQFEGMESAEYRSETGDFGLAPEAIWNAICVADLSDPESGALFDVSLSISAFDTNVLAFEHYEAVTSVAAELHSEAEVDQEFELGVDSAWSASRITAQENPTQQTLQRPLAAAALLGDFYAIQILVRFDPDTAEMKGCAADEEPDCVMTATSMAEFFATSGYLEDLHAGIEAAIDAA
ncbi:hypothetical protein [Glycomyces sp. NPDC047010]|uniref:hypothetical protein n=1 Tax=Glycomyces sp. NPDC047010 TaxID=3155023 RepID=UPI003408E0F5